MNWLPKCTYHRFSGFDHMDLCCLFFFDLRILITSLVSEAIHAANNLKAELKFTELKQILKTLSRNNLTKNKHCMTWQKMYAVAYNR
jgi:hypothetical protein